MKNSAIPKVKKKTPRTVKKGVVNNFSFLSGSGWEFVARKIILEMCGFCEILNTV